MMKVICRDCRHPEEVHNVDGKGTCACGCIRLTPIDRAAREARLRTWLVDVEFFVPQPLDRRAAAAGEGGWAWRRADEGHPRGRSGRSSALASGSSR